MLDLTQLETARSQSETDKKLLKWASIFKAETLEELEQLANGEEVFENMVVTMKQLSEDEKIRMQCEAREDYERCLITEYNAGKQDGIEQGIEQGIERGRIETLYNDCNMSVPDIAKKVSKSEDYVKEIIKKISAACL